MMGTAATSSPVSELSSTRSASESNAHGPMISTRANTSSARQCARTTVTAPGRAANGSSTSAPSAVRANTSTATETSATATLISRYGMPHSTHIAANRTHPRLLTALPRCTYPPRPAPQAPQTSIPRARSALREGAVSMVRSQARS